MKTITIEFNEPWGRGFRSFHGNVYYMASGNQYKFYEIRSNGHKLLTIYSKNEVKEIKETIHNGRVRSVRR